MADSDGSSAAPHQPERRRRRALPPHIQIDPDHEFDYKDIGTLRYFLNERGNLVPRRISGLSAKQQRSLTRAIKRARNIALLPFARSR
jgi:small subunit ribosomal protein S18